VERTPVLGPFPAGDTETIVCPPSIPLKPEGFGSGLSISRTIIEEPTAAVWYGPQLRITAAVIFRFELPAN